MAKKTKLGECHELVEGLLLKLCIIFMCDYRLIRSGASFKRVESLFLSLDLRS